MRALTRLEQALQQLLESPAAKLGKRRIHPVDLAVLLNRALEQGAMVGTARSYAPDRFTVRLHPSDLEPLAGIRERIEEELTLYVSTVAHERGLSFARRPQVQLVPEAGRPPGLPSVETGFAEAPVAEREPSEARPPSLRLRLPGGPGIPVERLPFAIGRALDNDLVLEDTRVSRHHARLHLLHGQVCVEDLGSSHGTRLNGEPVKVARLEPGDVLSLGGLEILVEAV